MRFSSAGEDRTLLELEHAAVVDDEWWATYGPGAVGVGWDLTLLGLAMHLDDGSTIEDRDAWYATPEAREFMTRSAQGVGRRDVDSRCDAGGGGRRRRGTTSAYVPDPEEA